MVRNNKFVSKKPTQWERKTLKRASAVMIIHACVVVLAVVCPQVRSRAVCSLRVDFETPLNLRPASLAVGSSKAYAYGFRAPGTDISIVRKRGIILRGNTPYLEANR
mmetsp:Transcript_46507/g.106676  ORF Transcript_46507/g.106676 Transcript_46507/m.106676 type:complete len:107 (+) Transcript_46507:239-559(+)